MSQLSENIFDERGGLRADLENVTVPPDAVRCSRRWSMRFEPPN